MASNRRQLSFKITGMVPTPENGWTSMPADVMADAMRREIGKEPQPLTVEGIFTKAVLGYVSILAVEGATATVELIFMSEDRAELIGDTLDEIVKARFFSLGLHNA